MEGDYLTHPADDVRQLSEVLRQLRQLLGQRSADFRSDFRYRFAVDRALQLAVDRAVATAESVLKFVGELSPRKKTNIFHTVAKLGFIRTGLADSLRCHVRFRNRLVHAYDDDPQFLAIRDLFRRRNSAHRSDFYDHVAPEVVEQDLRAFARAVAQHYPDYCEET